MMGKAPIHVKGGNECQTNHMRRINVINTFVSAENRQDQVERSVPEVRI